MEQAVQKTSKTKVTQAPERIEVSSSRVVCDGGDASLGHPRVYLEIGNRGFVECLYCDRLYFLRARGKAHAAH